MKNHNWGGWMNMSRPNWIGWILDDVNKSNWVVEPFHVIRPMILWDAFHKKKIYHYYNPHGADDLEESTFISPFDIYSHKCANYIIVKNIGHLNVE